MTIVAAHGLGDACEIDGRQGQTQSRLYQPVDLTEGDLLYFLHIPKTAGTSLTSFVEDHFPTRALCPYRYLEETLAVPREHWAAYQCVCGHQEYRLVERLARPPVCITLLRDPVARSVSHFIHIQCTPEHPFYRLFAGMSLEEFVRHPAGMCELCNLQTRFLGLGDSGGYVDYERLMKHEEYDRLLAMFQDPRILELALERLERFAFAGVSERYHESLALLCHVFGWPAPPEHVRYNARRATPREGVSSRAEQEILELTRLDRALYDAVAGRLDARLSRFDQEQARARYISAMRRRPLQASVHLRFERAIFGTHWLGREVLPDGRTCRWTGPAPEATLDLRLNPRNSWTVEFCAGTYRPELLDTLRLFVHDEQLTLDRYPASDVDGSAAVFRARIPASAMLDDLPYTRLRFRVERTVVPCDEEPGHPDDRPLGIFFHWIDVF